MWIFCGLGNPGKEYELTRHNYGFLALDAFAQAKGLIFEKDPSIEAEIARYRNRAILMKPQTYMNLSGRAVVKALRKFNLTPENLLVIYDDLDLPLGRMKLLPKGGAGGHRGILSIIESLRTENFPRLRLGIGRPNKLDARNYVLSPFTEEELPIVEKVLEIVCKALEEILYTDLHRVMTKINSLKEVSSTLSGPTFKL